MTAFRSVLIVEDEPLIAMMLEDFLESFGHVVAGTCDSVADALMRIESGGFDIAIVDVHLKGGEHAWPICDRLAEMGIPFVLATGGHIEPPPHQHANAPVLTKPFTIDAIEPVLTEACRV
ncbi:response regulator [Sphingosinicella rhizophila]|uniref:Response regulator n=1 Tax=Sphingosinicella rhizophila TaxID=3050082 RepID=A0ABU3Q2U5_9SPHN|nr:response regulator [Sphingosinicella sp. GR2756]MDT9597704.1 response regulator [Sphingosinicella sp. GR2756]